MAGRHGSTSALSSRAISISRVTTLSNHHGRFPRWIMSAATLACSQSPLGHTVSSFEKYEFAVASGFHQQ